MLSEMRSNFGIGILEIDESFGRLHSSFRHFLCVRREISENYRKDIKIIEPMLWKWFFILNIKLYAAHR